MKKIFIKLIIMTIALLIFSGCKPLQNDKKIVTQNESNPNSQTESKPNSQNVSKTKLQNTKIVTMDFMTTNNWFSYESDSNLGKCKFSVDFPTGYEVQDTIINLKNEKVGEFSPPVYIKDGQIMPADITNDEYAAELKTKVLKKEHYSENGKEIYLVSYDFTYASDGEGGFVKWYPTFLYIKIDNIMLNITFYPNSIPNLEQLSEYKNIVSTMRIIE
jgi:hypothetical protein